MSQILDSFQRYLSLGKRDPELETLINRELHRVNLSLQTDVEPDLKFIKDFHDAFCKHLNNEHYKLKFSRYKVKSMELDIPFEDFIAPNYTVPDTVSKVYRSKHPYQYIFTLEGIEGRYFHIRLILSISTYTPDSSCEILIHNNEYDKHIGKDYTFGESTVSIRDLFDKMKNLVLNCYVVGNQEVCEICLLDTPDDLVDEEEDDEDDNE